MNSHPITVALFLALFLAFALAPLHADTFVIDKKRSQIAVDAKATNHKFTGVLKDFDVKIVGVSKSLVPTKVELKWDFKNLDTADKKRNKNMLKWLEHGKKPTGSFILTKWIYDGKGQTFARGNLTIHGIKKQITFPCKVTRKGKTITAVGNAQLTYTDFGLPHIRQLVVLTVNPKLNIRFTLVGTSK